MSDRWQFYACEVTTGKVTTDLPLVDFSGEVSLLGKGAMSAKLPMAHLSYTQRRSLLDGTQPGRASVIALRDGTVQGEWVIWTRTRSNDFGSVDLKGNEILSYGDRRLMQAWSWSQVDQLHIAADLVGAMFSGSLVAPVGAGAVVMTIDPYVLSGQLRDRSWAALDGTIAARLRELAEVDGGFDLVFHPAWRATGTAGIDRHCTLYYPRAGTDTGQVLEMAGAGFGQGQPVGGGNILDFHQDENGSGLASRAYAVGETQGDTALIGIYQDITLIDQGWPFLETSASYTTVKLQPTIDAYARALWQDSQRLEDPVPGSILADTAPVVGSYALGDVMTVHLDPSVNYPDGFDGKVRILGWTFKPPAAGVESITLTTTRELT